MTRKRSAVCQVDGCQQAATAPHGLCNKHYQRLRYHRKLIIAYDPGVVYPPPRTTENVDWLLLTGLTVQQVAQRLHCSVRHVQRLRSQAR
jgi:AraC-like DNA-binding protein